MNFRRLSIILLLGIPLAGCGIKSTCPEGSGSYLDELGQFPPDTSASLTSQKTYIDTKNKTVAFDWVIEGPSCNDTWENSLFVGCDLRLQQWEI